MLWMRLRYRIAVGVAVACVAVASSGVGVPSASAAGDANEAFCSTETEASPGFRSYLPDCRAYELVTPPFKGGDSFMEGFPRASLVSADGSRVIAASLGVLAGTEGDLGFGNFTYPGALYEMTRGGGGWSIGALDPPQPRFEKDAEFWGASVDLSRTAWIVVEPGASQPQHQLFIQEPGKNFVEVGPTEPGHVYINKAHVVGSDEDLNTLVLSLENNGLPGSLWPGDPTVNNRNKLSLYEYTGVHQEEPAMVAVRNEGKLRHNAEAEPITPCGNQLGAAGQFGSTYDAVSDAGDAVFFTANGEAECKGEPSSAPAPKVNELYARIAGEKTLPLSEPPLSGPGSIQGRECTGTCRTDEESSPSPATYQGASADGTKVFFTTEQPLVEAATAGGPYLYEETIAKEGVKSSVTSLTLLGSHVEGVVRVSADGSRVYFVSTGALAGNENSEDQKAIEGEGDENLYVYDTTQTQGQPVYIATLAEADKRVWTASDGGRLAQASLSDGRFLVFSSHEHLTPHEAHQSASGLRQLFEYDAEAGRFGQLMRVSIGQDGYNEDGAIQSEANVPVLADQQFNNPEESGDTDQALVRIQSLSVTEAGVVFFTSAAKLTPLALGGFNNVYEYRDGDVYLISDGQDATLNAEPEPESVVSLISTTSSGDDVFFQTADSLVPQDGDGQLDFYDARVDGGFPAPVVQAPCGESCEDGGSPLPILGSPSSSGYSGGVNLSPPAPPKVAVKSKRKSVTRAQELAKALKACERKPKRERAVCVRQAEKRYGSKSKASRANRRGSK
jgi:hypothetical protein